MGEDKEDEEPHAMDKGIQMTQAHNPHERLEQELLHQSCKLLPVASGYKVSVTLFGQDRKKRVGEDKEDEEPHAMDKGIQMTQAHNPHERLEQELLHQSCKS